MMVDQAAVDELLLSTIQSGDLAAVKALLAAGARFPLTLSSFPYRTAMLDMAAARCDNVEIFDYLLKRGAQFTEVALWHAFSKDSTAVLELFGRNLHRFLVYKESIADRIITLTLSKYDPRVHTPQWFAENSDDGGEFINGFLSTYGY